MLQDTKQGINGYEVLEKVTGIPKSEQIKIMEDIQRNRQTLESCSRHDFSEEVEQPHRINKKWKCSRCGGIVDYSEKLWYERGLAHASQGGKNEKDT